MVGIVIEKQKRPSFYLSDVFRLQISRMTNSKNLAFIQGGAESKLLIIIAITLSTGNQLSYVLANMHCRKLPTGGYIVTLLAANLTRFV